MVADINTLLIASLAAGIVLVGIGWTMARRRQAADSVANTIAPDPAPDVEPDDAILSTSVLPFTRELFAAQTMADLRRAIAQRLPSLLGTRRLWISGQVGGQRQLIVPERTDGDPERLTNGDFEEWTTSPLRAGPNVVGVIGIETRTARSERTQLIISMVAPFIGQALENAIRVDALREASLMDALTGTATRREGLTRLHAELKRAKRTGSSMALLLLDLDGFKSINDRFGHATGDAVLRAIGQTLQRTLRASDIRCRWGGEEFLVAVPDTDITRAQIVAGGLLRNIAATTVPLPQGPVGTTASIGVTMTRPREIDVETMIQRADIALYQAKDAGRGVARVILGDGGEVPQVQAVAQSNSGETITLPFPDRRNPDRPDRRRVPSGGRRSTDLQQ
jgi:diguanylate cyclase (GGDEF)-like protein